MHEQFSTAKHIDQAFGQLVEELGEAVTAAGKLQRFGPYSVNPLIPKDQQEFNVDWLLRELDDVENAARQFREFLARPAADLPPGWVRRI